MDTSTLNNRSTERVQPRTQTVVLHGLVEGPVPAIVIDESFGGLGVAAPVHLNTGSEVDIELCVEMGGIRSNAIVRHSVALPSGCRLGIEWKAQALSRCLRDLLSVESTSEKLQPLVRILPGGLSVMWKLFEAQRFSQLLHSADRLRKEAAACGVTELSGPIEKFQCSVREVLDGNNDDDASDIIEQELNTLIRKCIDTITA